MLPQSPSHPRTFFILFSSFRRSSETSQVTLISALACITEQVMHVSASYQSLQTRSPQRHTAKDSKHPSTVGLPWHPPLAVASPPLPTWSSAPSLPACGPPPSLPLWPRGRLAPTEAVHSAVRSLSRGKPLWKGAEMRGTQCLSPDPHVCKERREGLACWIEGGCKVDGKEGRPLCEV